MLSCFSTISIVINNRLYHIFFMNISGYLLWSMQVIVFFSQEWLHTYYPNSSFSFVNNFNACYANLSACFTAFGYLVSLNTLALIKEVIAYPCKQFSLMNSFWDSKMFEAAKSKLCELTSLSIWLACIYYCLKYICF